ncbi:MAG: ATP-dependent RecD-like DNA helicase [Helcococcus sp.]|nr:ATP-dependent RecD-like DNA helicase [Helcococcus sp.]
MIETTGTVEDIIYRNEENLYSVFLLDTDDGLVTVVGQIFDLNKGDILAVTGDLVFHKDYGEQIKLNSYKKLMPSSLSQIEKYLSSGIISNIGKKRAKEIVKKFGEDTLRIMTEEPKKLLKIGGIGKKTLEKIHKSVLKAQSSREVSIYLQKFNLGNKLSYQIFAKYKEDTKAVIEENPYQLIDDIKGIGFNIADKIALHIGIKKDSSFRITAGAEYLLYEEANKNGNCYMDYEEFLISLSDLLAISRETILNNISQMVLWNRIKIINYENKDIIYLRSIYDIELSITENLLKLMRANSKIVDTDIDKEIEYIEKTENIEYSNTQKKAIKTALEEKVMIITGGPGTGKTTIIKAIISIIHNLKFSYLLAAPTGRAAKRMEESTGKEASTIHRLLGYKSIGDSAQLEFNEDNPLDSDLIIIDEMSMVDIFLMNNLLKAIKEDTMVVFVGDSDQLPSVGPGNVLNDMINSNILPTIKLDTIFRQGEGSNIIRNAHLINHGMKPILNEENKDFFFIKTRDDRHTLDTICELVVERLPKYYNVNPLEDIQVLTPTRRGICGVDSINQRLQAKLNPPEFNKSEIKLGEFIFRENDKIMQTKNNYDIELKDNFFEITKGLYNGDIGFIRNIFLENKTIETKFYDKMAILDTKDFQDIVLSYCATIHKSQGSEFPIVVIPMANAPYMLLTRNILYTGITRGKSLVVLVGNENILNKMINTEIIDRRKSTLAYNLKKYYNLRRNYD